MFPLSVYSCFSNKLSNRLPWHLSLSCSRSRWRSRSLQGTQQDHNIARVLVNRESPSQVATWHKAFVQERKRKSCKKATYSHQQVHVHTQALICEFHNLIVGSYVDIAFTQKKVLFQTFFLCRFVSLFWKFSDAFYIKQYNREVLSFPTLNRKRRSHFKPGNQIFLAVTHIDLSMHDSYQYMVFC